MNDTLGPNSAVPSTLVFGEHPPVFTQPLTSKIPSKLEGRAKIAFNARKEMKNYMAKLQAGRALRHAIQVAADVAYERNYEVLIWREKQINNRIGRWKGPYIVEDWDPGKKLAYVRDSSVGPCRPFNLAQVKKYLCPDVSAQTFAFEVFKGVRNMSHASDTRMTEVIASVDPRAESAEMKKAIRKEVEGLMSRGCFKVRKTRQVPQNTNVLPCKYVLAVKYGEKDEQRYKARFVLEGHRDGSKAFLLHTSQTVQQLPTRLLLASLEMNDFSLWSEVAFQAYTQGDEPLARLVFINDVSPEFNLKEDECFHVIKPVYGLSDSGDLLHSTIDRYHCIALHMVPLASNQGLFFVMADEKLSGMSGIYVDNLLRIGDKSFHQKCKATPEKLNTKVKTQLPIEITDISTERSSNGMLTVGQNRYLRKLKDLPSNSKFSELRSMRVKLERLANTHPDVLSEIASLAQVTLEHFNSDRNECIKRLNRAVRYEVNHRVPMAIPKLNKDSVRVVGFSDTSFANNCDLSTQLGYIIFLADVYSYSAPMIFKSYMKRRITQSATAGEVIAFADMGDAAVTLTKEVERLLHRRVAIQLMINSKFLFDVISKGSRTSGKRLMLDIAAAHEQFRVMDVSDIGLVRSADNLGDGLTKSMQQAILRDVIGSGKLMVNPFQMIISPPLKKWQAGRHASGNKEWRSL